MSSCVLAVLAAVACGQPTDRVRMSFEEAEVGWSNVERVADGARGGAVRFSDRNAKIDAGPLPVDSREAFTLGLSIRTREAGFSTALMARDGERVGASFVMGRAPGKVSFEAWSWSRVKLISRSRIDDGAWHRIEAAYEPVSNVAVLRVDGRVEAAARLGEGSSREARLRLGNNIGADQPFSGDLDELVFVRSVEDRGSFSALAPMTSAEEKARELAALRERSLPRTTPIPGDVGKWHERRVQVRAGVADALGLSPLPERRALEPIAHGELSGQGVRVQRVSFASWPGYRATGWLWLPEHSPPGRLPAVLMPHGHWANGAIEDVVQVRAARMARAGYISLVVDSVHVEDVASGVNSVGAMTWNNIRALDYLLSREDVDPERIGVTGASGGAQQTMYLMAMEDRIRAAVPVCMISYFAEIMDDRTAHCGCNHVPRIGAVADGPEICAVFAPRPALFVSATGDWTHNFVRQGWPEIRKVYSLVGREDAVGSFEANAGHGYDGAMRGRAYAFFDGLFRPANVGASEEGSRPIDAGALHRLGPPARAPERAAMVAEYRTRRAKVSSLRSLAPGLSWGVQAGGWEDRGAVSPGSVWKRCTAMGADGVHIPVLARGLEGPAEGSVTMVVAPEGRTGVVMDPPMWLRKLERVVIVEPRFSGDWEEFREAWRRNGLLMGCGEGYQTAQDIAQAAQSLPGNARVRLVARGWMGVSALIAAQLCSRIELVVVEDAGVRFAADGNRAPLCPEILRFGDLPELVMAVAPGCRVVAGGMGDVRDVFRPGARVSTNPLTAQEVGAALGAAE